MDLLILGGTLFLGRHLVDAATARGHRVTLFHRGRTQPALFPGIEHRFGDRDGGLDALDGGRWDAVVDTSGYLPRVVSASAERLASRVAHYTFVSSISVYADASTPGAHESSPVGSLSGADPEVLTGESYGPLKALCERAVDAWHPGRALHVRPGLIVGPHDPTDRFTWWARRIARGGDVLAPGRPEAPVQCIDARDLAGWMIEMIESVRTGTFNATGPATPLTLGAVLETCRAVAESDARWTWVDEAFLLSHRVTPWTELPLWVPAENAGFMQADASRARAAGLRFRPLEDTVRDTLAWDRATPAADRPQKAGLAFPVGLAPEREVELLREWNARRPA